MCSTYSKNAGCIILCPVNVTFWVKFREPVGPYYRFICNSEVAVRAEALLPPQEFSVCLKPPAAMMG